MPRFLAIDWDHQQLYVVTATVSGRTVRIQEAAVFREPLTPNPGEAEALGRRLREHLKTAGIAPAPVLACLGRDRVILKEIRHPPVPEAEEPAIVRFQAVKELTEPPDEVVIDYTPIGATGNGGERRALALIARRELLQAYQTLCQAAGLKLAALTPRAFGIAASVRHAIDAAPALAVSPEEATAGPPTVAVLTVAERWAEFCVVRGDTLLFVRALAIGPGLAGEVRRNLAVHAGQSPQQPIRALYLAGDGEHVELRERLQELLPVPVHTFDPLARAERVELAGLGRGAFAGAAGLLRAQARAQGLPINFARIKQPTRARAPNRRKLLLAAAVALLLLVVGSGWCYSALAARDQELFDLNLANADLDRQLVPLEEEAKYYKALSDWSDGEVVWLDEIYDLADRFPSNSGLRLIELQCLGQSHIGKDKHIGSMTLTGITREDQLAQTLLANLNEDSRYYRVNPLEITQNTSGVDRFQNFNRKFTTRLDIEKRSPTEYKRVLTLPSEETAPQHDARRPGSRNNRGRNGGRQP